MTLAKLSITYFVVFFFLFGQIFIYKLFINRQELDQGGTQVHETGDSTSDYISVNLSIDTSHLNIPLVKI